MRDYKHPEWGNPLLLFISVRPFSNNKSKRGDTYKNVKHKYCTTMSQMESSLNHTVEQLENLENAADLEVLDVSYQAQLDGTITEITLTVTTGGPQIEIKLAEEAVIGYWGGETRRKSVGEYANKDAFEATNRLWGYYHTMVKAEAGCGDINTQW